MMFVLEGSSETPFVNRCVSGYDLGYSLDTNGTFSPVNEVTGGYHSKIQINDEFVNQALYTLWRGGLMCFTVDDNIFALDTGILNLLSGDAFRRYVSRFTTNGHQYHSQKRTCPQYDNRCRSRH